MNKGLVMVGRVLSRLAHQGRRIYGSLLYRLVCISSYTYIYIYTYICYRNAKKVRPWSGKVHFFLLQKKKQTLGAMLDPFLMTFWWKVAVLAAKGASSHKVLFEGCIWEQDRSFGGSFLRHFGDFGVILNPIGF